MSSPYAESAPVPLERLDCMPLVRMVAGMRSRGYQKQQREVAAQK